MYCKLDVVSGGCVGCAVVWVVVSDKRKLMRHCSYREYRKFVIPSGERNGVVSITPSIRKRFWDKVDIAGETECWMWNAATRRNYGVIHIDGTTVNAHRLSYQIEHGEEPEHFVLHKCDTPPCVNPNHLYDGTPSENAQDWYDRQNAAEKFKHENNPNAELTVEEVKEIKRKIDDYTHAEIADEYGVGRSTIAFIATGRNWADVEP